MDEIDVEVVIIVLLELDRVQVLRRYADVLYLKLFEKCLKNLLILWVGFGCHWLWLLLTCSLPWELNLDSLGLEGLSMG
jgi:hypothetical protein